MELDPIYKTIGETIRARRRRFHLTQEKLAPRIGMSRASLANIETGRQTILVHQLYRLAEVLEISPADLLPVPAAESERTDTTEIELPDDLNPQQKRQIARLMK